MKIGDKIINYCSDCYKVTNHTILFFKKVDGSDDYHQSNFYALVECNGCNNVSYRSESVDYEQMYFNEHADGWYPSTDVNTYPKSLKEHKNELSTHLLPSSIEVVYSEAIKAFANECNLLTAVAFRTIIEAICIDKKIVGRNLEIKINNLVKFKLITEKEAERLHSIRFMGNDSVHEMTVPTKKNLDIVLNIIEHLLNNIYIIDDEIKGKLETVIKNFDELHTLLNKKLNGLNVGDSLTLAKILDHSIRRLTDKSQIENELKDKIKNGEYKRLSLGELKDNQDPKKEKIQYYTIMAK